MPERDRLTLRPILVGAVLAIAAPALVGCLPGGTARETMGAIAWPAPPLMPSATEAAYIGDTARTVFRRRPSEQGDRFVMADPIAGYGACVRSEAPGGYKYALIVLQRRIFEAAISQVDDDAIILRGADDTAICRDPSAGFDWVQTA